jgi:hypothetical protein
MKYTPLAFFGLLAVLGSALAVARTQAKETFFLKCHSHQEADGFIETQILLGSLSNIDDGSYELNWSKPEGYTEVVSVGSFVVVSDGTRRNFQLTKRGTKSGPFINWSEPSSAGIVEVDLQTKTGAHNGTSLSCE